MLIDSTTSISIKEVFKDAALQHDQDQPDGDVLDYLGSIVEDSLDGFDGNAAGDDGDLGSLLATLIETLGPFLEELGVEDENEIAQVCASVLACAGLSIVGAADGDGDATAMAALVAATARGDDDGMELIENPVVLAEAGGAELDTVWQPPPDKKTIMLERTAARNAATLGFSSGGGSAPTSTADDADDSDASRDSGHDGDDDDGDDDSSSRSSSGAANEAAAPTGAAVEAATATATAAQPKKPANTKSKGKGKGKGRGGRKVRKRDKKRAKREAEARRRAGGGSATSSSAEARRDGSELVHRMPVTKGARVVERTDHMTPEELALHLDLNGNISETRMTRFHMDYVGESLYIHLYGLNINFDGRDLLDGAELKLSPGRRYGLVGANGVGKTTLLSRMASGRVQNWPRYLNTIYVEQEVVGDETRVIDCLVEADLERKSLLEEEARLMALANEGVELDPKLEVTDFAVWGARSRLHRMPKGHSYTEAKEQPKVLDKLNEVYEALELIDADSAEGRAIEILQGFGFTRAMMEGPTSALSGGWRMRVSLAQALFLKPHVLLFDEPTNHLDLHATLWLQRFLTSGTTEDQIVVVVSHDRAFLNAVTSDTIIFANQTLHYHQGNLDSYEARMAELAAKHQHDVDRAERKRAHIEQTIANVKKNAKKHKDTRNMGMIRSRKKKLEDYRFGHEKTHDGKKWKLSYMGYRSDVADVKHHKAWSFSFPEPIPLRSSGDILISMEDVSFKYETKKRPTLREVQLSVRRRARVAIVGPNGSGKSTLINLLSGSLTPDSGLINTHPNLVVSYYTQHHVDQLDLSLSPMEHISAELGDSTALDVRTHLGIFGLAGSICFQPISTLSGGQKARLVLATITLGRPNLLILDEPTNHLDFETINALTDALDAYEGGILFVSHDQTLLSRLADEIWVVGRGRVTHYPGSFAEYVADVTASFVDDE